MSLTRLLFGDWGRVIRDPLDVMRLAFLAGTIAYAVMGRTTAAGLGAATLVLLIARLVDIPRSFDLALVLAMFLIAWGTALDLYGHIFWYDNLVHAVAPIFYSPVIYILLIRASVLPNLGERREAHHHAGVFVVTLAIGMAVTAGYEVVEWLSDTLVGTHLQHGADDTGGDLLSGTIGAAIGGLLMVLWGVRGWTTVRRVPGERLQSVLHGRTATRFVRDSRS